MKVQRDPKGAFWLSCLTQAEAPACLKPGKSAEAEPVQDFTARQKESILTAAREKEITISKLQHFMIQYNTIQRKIKPFIDYGAEFTGQLPQQDSCGTYGFPAVPSGPRLPCGPAPALAPRHPRFLIKS